MCKIRKGLVAEVKEGALEGRKVIIDSVNIRYGLGDGRETRQEIEFDNLTDIKELKKCDCSCCWCCWC